MVDMWRTIIPVTIHIEVVRALQWNCTNAANFFAADGTRKRNLTGHRSSTDDRLVEAELLNQGSNAADVRVFIVRVITWMVSLIRE